MAEELSKSQQMYRAIIKKANAHRLFERSTFVIDFTQSIGNGITADTMQKFDYGDMGITPEDLANDFPEHQRLVLDAWAGFRLFIDEYWTNNIGTIGYCSKPEGIEQSMRSEVLKKFQDVWNVYISYLD